MGGVKSSETDVVWPSAPAPTRTVDRALALLAQVCANSPVNLADCARLTELAPSTALRLLRTLESSGFVRRADDGTFRSGPRLIQLGALAYGRESLVGEVEPALARIVGECGESAYLAVPGPTGTGLYVGMVEGTYSVRHTSWVGRTVTLDGTALGAAMRDLVGADGFAAQRSGVEADVAAVAAPIRRAGPQGQPLVVAVINVVGPSYRLDDQRLRALGLIVSREAQTLSERFGTTAGVAG
jgi:IclR family acetate operon transcriptional repressor